MDAVFGQTIVAGGAVARNSDGIKSTLKTEGYHDSNIVVPGTPGVVGMTTYGAVGDDIIKQWSSMNNKTSALARFRPVTDNSWYVYMDRAKYFVDLDSCYVYSIHPILWQCYNTFLFLTLAGCSVCDLLCTTSIENVTLAAITGTVTLGLIQLEIGSPYISSAEVRSSFCFENWLQNCFLRLDYMLTSSMAAEQHAMPYAIPCYNTLRPVKMAAIVQRHFHISFLSEIIAFSVEFF